MKSLKLLITSMFMIGILIPAHSQFKNKTFGNGKVVVKKGEKGIKINTVNKKKVNYSNAFSGMTILKVKDYNPVKHGFKFTNSFPVRILQGLDKKGLDKELADKISENTKYGLCGGMALASHEMFLYNLKVPTRESIPNIEDPLYYYLVDALMDSFGDRKRNVVKLKSWHIKPEAELQRLSYAELLGVKQALSAGKPVQLMLLYNIKGKGRLWDNHQVLAYGLQESKGKGYIQIYDPNEPLTSASRINYTIVGDAIEMEQPLYNQDNKPSTNDQGQPLYRSVYGFFTVNEPLQNPVTRPAYLATRGKQAYIKGMKALNKSAFTIANGLYEFYKMRPEDIAKELKNAGFKVQDVALMLKSKFNYSADRVAITLKRMGYRSNEVADVLRKKFSATASTASKSLKRAGYNATETAQALKSNFQQNAQQAFTLLQKAGFRTGDIVGAVKSQFNTTTQQMITMLKNINTKTNDIANLLKSKYGQSNQAIVNALKSAGVPIPELGDVMRTTLGITKGSDAVSILKRANVSRKDVINILKSRYNYGASTMAKTLKSAYNMSALDVAKQLKSTYNASVNTVASALRNGANYSIADCISALRSAFNLGLAQARKLFN